VSLAEVKGWFQLSRKEQLFLAGLLGLFLLGLVARYLHLRGVGPEPVTVEEAEGR
jgi:hypothetical protein